MKNLSHKNRFLIHYGMSIVLVIVVLMIIAILKLISANQIFDF